MTKSMYIHIANLKINILNKKNNWNSKSEIQLFYQYAISTLLYFYVQLFQENESLLLYVILAFDNIF